MKEQQRQQIALVTGSASGIGFETALMLARNGIYTFATMRNLSKSEEILDYARKDHLPLETLRLDVTDEQSISEAESLAGIFSQRSGVGQIVAIL
ncbi:MAG: SDR family NAD(P)-dependent oxidoreductase [Nitrososphaeraceae archaeon]|jgi:NAD(P)-dependent dehydrogenase (short-subunit alcohol dehydrogenase family)